jgi:hypothetical protein
MGALMSAKSQDRVLFDRSKLLGLLAFQLVNIMQIAASGLRFTADPLALLW